MKICISRIDKMGDMILTLPVIKGIKIRNPNFKIYVIASKRNEMILDNLNYVDEVITLDINQSNKYINSLKKIRAYNFDIYLNISPISLSYFCCFFAKAKIKATMIFLSRYKKSFFSQLQTKILSRIFCKYVHTINRFEKLNENQDIHHTNMIFNFLRVCQIEFEHDIQTEISLPKKKLFFFNKEKNIIVIHATKRWINEYYKENDFLDLLEKLPNKYRYFLTTDDNSKNRFNSIYKKYKIYNNESFEDIKSIKDKITILDQLNYKNWLNVIYSSKTLVTPECGALHIAGACNVPVTIIYDADYYPEKMYKEYHPWKSKHTKLISNDPFLNNKIVKQLI